MQKELKTLFLHKEDAESLAKVNDLNTDIEKNAFYAKKRCHTPLTDYFS